MVMAKYKYRLIKFQKSNLLSKKLKTIKNTTYHMSISTTKAKYICKIYSINEKTETCLVLPLYPHYNPDYILAHLDYNPLKLFYINEDSNNPIDD